VVTLPSASQEPANSAHVLLAGRGSCRAARPPVCVRELAAREESSHGALPAACSLQHALQLGTLRRGQAIKAQLSWPSAQPGHAGESRWAAGRCRPGAAGHGHQPALAVLAPWPPTCAGRFRPVAAGAVREGG